MNGDETESANLARIRGRIAQKRLDYLQYHFSHQKDDILKTFFDLVQEFDTIHDLFRVAVSVPQDVFGVDNSLYLFDDCGNLELVCDSKNGVCPDPPPAPDYIHPCDTSYESGRSFIVPIQRKPPRFREYEQKDDANILGIFEVRSLNNLSEEDKFFFTKYANRIGYNLRKKILAQHNINHLKFINNLVDDIEHNVIVPNMHYKTLFNRLRRHIDGLSDLSAIIETYKKDKNSDHRLCLLMADKVVELKKRLNSSYDDIARHHVNSSLFLESLLRRDHFEKGYFVLQRRICKLDADIIIPQLQNYERRMAIRGISIERPADMRGEEIEINADLGLLSQVYANLFSNVLKYAQSIVDEHGVSRKFVAYGRKIIEDYFGAGEAAIKLNVFSTGEHIAPDETGSLFEDGFMGRHTSDDLSRGHGLAFIKYVIEMHGGIVGYEPTRGGNNFYFVIPLLKLS